MFAYIVQRKIGDRTVTGKIRAKNNRAILEKLKNPCGVKSTAKLRPKLFFNAGFVSVHLGNRLIYPAKKKKACAPKHKHQRHPRLVQKRAVMLAA